MQSYLPLFFMLILAGLFGGISFFASSLLSPKNPTAAKLAPYECGIIPTKEPPERFPVGFYLVAMIFIVFDIEVIFTFPWALIFGELNLFGLIEMGVFAIVVVASFMFLLSNGALNWGPAKRVVEQLEKGLRTTETSVERISNVKEDKAA